MYAEPTTGLDARSALMVVRVMKNLANSGQKDGGNFLTRNLRLICPLCTQAVL